MLSICKNTAVVVQLLSQIWLCDPMDYSTPGFPILHYFPEFAQSHVHWVSDAIQPSHSFLPPFPPSLSLSQHRGLFQWSWLFASGGQSMGASTSASVLPFNLQGWFPLGFWLLWSFSIPKKSQESSPGPQLESITSLTLSLLLIQLSHPFMTAGKIIALSIHTFVDSYTSAF